MVNTRRLAQSPRDDVDRNATETPMSAKQLRQIRKLTIDGESALGGGGTSKRRRTVGRSSLNPDTPSPSTVNGPRTESPRLSATPQAQPTKDGATPRAEPRSGSIASRPHQSHSPAQRRLNSRSNEPTIDFTQPKALPPPQLRSNPPHPREQLWFLPSESSRESTPTSQSRPIVAPLANASQNPPSPALTDLESAGLDQAGVSKPQDWSITSATGQAYQSIFTTQNEDAAPHTADHSASRLSQERGVARLHDKPEKTEPQRARRKSRLTKAQKEQKRLVFDPGHVPISEGQPSTDAISTPQPQPETKHVTRRAGNPVLAQPQPLDQENPAVIRALKKLEIAANTSLGGVEPEPLLPAAGDRRSTRILRGTGPQLIRRQKPLRRPQDSQPRVLRRIEPFPNHRSEALADHLLSLLAGAAHEHQIVRLLAGDARNAIMRDIRNEGFYSQQQRLQHELTVMQSWDLASDAEITRLTAVFDANKENFPHLDKVDTVHEDLTHDNEAGPDGDSARSRSSQRNLNTYTEDLLADNIRRMSGCSREGYFTASDAASTDPRESDTDQKSSLRGQKRSADTYCKDDILPSVNGNTWNAADPYGDFPTANGYPRANGAKRPRLINGLGSTEGLLVDENSAYQADAQVTSDHDTPQDE